MTSGTSQGRYQSRGFVELRPHDRFRKVRLLTPEELHAMKQRVRKDLRRVKQILTARKRYRAITNTPAAHLLTPGQWEQIKARYRYRCAYCYRPKPLTKDHVIPLSKGGQHTQFNVIPACQACNSRKRDRPALQYNPLIFRRV